MATATSVKAYRPLSEHFQRQRDLIRTQIKAAGYAGTCIADIAAALDLQKSTVSARMNELKTAGAIVHAGQRKSNTTGILSDHFRIKPSEYLFEGATP
jgi:hypothetical protein